MDASKPPFSLSDEELFGLGEWREAGFGEHGDATDTQSLLQRSSTPGPRNFQLSRVSAKEFSSGFFHLHLTGLCP